MSMLRHLAPRVTVEVRQDSATRPGARDREPRPVMPTGSARVSALTRVSLDVTPERRRNLRGATCPQRLNGKAPGRRPIDSAVTFSTSCGARGTDATAQLRAEPAAFTGR
jgi:hypothetical protein